MLHALILVSHHSLLDGRGAAQLVLEWLAEMGRVARGEPPQAGSHTPAPPLGAVVSPPSLTERATYRLRRLATRLRAGPVADGVFEQRGGPAERSTGVLTSSFPVGPLRARARREATTVQGAFQTAVAIAVREAFGLTGPLPISTPLNLRAHVEPRLPPDALGCYVASLETRDAGGDTMQFWERACEARRELSRLLARKDWRMAFDATRSRIEPLKRRLDALAADEQRQGRVHFLAPRTWAS